MSKRYKIGNYKKKKSVHKPRAEVSAKRNLLRIIIYPSLLIQSYKKNCLKLLGKPQNQKRRQKNAPKKGMQYRSHPNGRRTENQSAVP